MMERIIVNGVDLELYPSKRVNLNLTISKFGEIGKRRSSYSNTISIPRTVKNQKVMEFAGMLGSQTSVPYTKTMVDYLISGATMIRQGYMVLTDTTADSYKILLLDGIVDLKEALGESTLQDLEYGDLDHYLSLSTFNASFSNTEGYIWALGDFGQGLGSTSILEVELQAPSIFAHTIWEKIWSSLGKTYTGDFFDNDTDWKTLVLPPSNGIDIVEAALSVTGIGTSGTDTDSANTTDQFETNQEFEHTIGTDGYDSNLTLTGGDIQVNFTGTLRLNITSTHTLTSGTIYMVIKQNGVPKITKLMSGGSTSSTVTMEVTSGDILKTFTVASADIDYINGTSALNYSISHSIQAESLSGGTFIDVGATVSDMKQIDFIKDIMKRYGLIAMRSRLNPNEYRFIQIDSMLSDRLSAVDMSGKVVDLISEGYTSGYAQENTADYKYAEDAIENMDGSLLTDHQNSDLKRVLFDSIFEIPKIQDNVNNNPIYLIPIWEVDSSSNLENADTPAKLMRVDIDASSVGFNLFGSATSNYTNVPYLSLVDMDMQHFIDTYFSKFKLVLDKYKEVEAALSLDIVDYLSIDLFKLVYLKQTGKYYYLDTVKIGKTDKAKLIEIPNF